MDEMRQLLSGSGVHDTVVEVLQKNRITRAILMKLNRDDLAEMGITALGDRILLQDIINDLKNSPSMAFSCPPTAASSIPAPSDFHDIPLSPLSSPLELEEIPPLVHPGPLEEEQNSPESDAPYSSENWVRLVY